MCTKCHNHIHCSIISVVFTIVLRGEENEENKKGSIVAHYYVLLCKLNCCKLDTFCILPLPSICLSYFSLRQQNAREDKKDNEKPNNKTGQRKKNTWTLPLVKMHLPSCFYTPKRVSKRGIKNIICRGRVKITTTREKKWTLIRSEYTINIILCRLFADENLY